MAFGGQEAVISKILVTREGPVTGTGSNPPISGTPPSYVFPLGAQWAKDSDLPHTLTTELDLSSLLLGVLRNSEQYAPGPVVYQSATEEPQRSPGYMCSPVPRSEKDVDFWGIDRLLSCNRD